MKLQTLKIGLGTAAIGRPQYINLRQETPAPFDLPAFREQGLRVLEEAYAMGVRYFDTAPGYGMAEQLMIHWIREKQYEDVEIATKWGYTYTANFDPNAAVHEVKEHSLAKLNEQWEQSRQLLPWLKAYQIHSATFESGVLENQPVLDRLAELKAEHGLAIGLTTSGANQKAVLEKSLEIERDGRPLFDLFQVTFNILDQSLLEIAKSLTTAGKRIVVKEGLANGRLFPNPSFPHYAGLYRAMEKLAGKYGVGVDAVALRYCRDALDPFMVLSGAALPSHLRQNLKAAAFRLADAEVAELAQHAANTDEYWAERKGLAWN